MLTLGTGVGGGVVIDGVTFRGAHGLGAELGHFTLNPDGPPCPGNCPNRGCIEAYCSGQALERDATELAQDKPDSRLARCIGAGGTVTGRDLVEVAEAGDTDALLVFDNFARMLGIAIAGYVNVFEPEHLAIGGGLSRASHLFFDRAVQEAGMRALPALWRRTKIALAQGGADAGVIGAGVLAAQEIRGIQAPLRDTPSSRTPIDRKGRMTTSGAQLDELCINTIRTLSMDAVQKANSGHPGAPMALAPLAYLLYTRVMKHNPANADWFDRDRFVLSAGHASMLLYSSLYLTGYGLTLEDLENFRQLGSPTAGHPERGDAAGIEVTTGPLGQGISMAVGLALAEAHAGRALQPPGPRADRPPHLHDRKRRRHAGGRGLGGLLARRPPRARQADRLLRQQPHPARRQDRDGLLRGRGQALRGLRLARPGPGRGHHARAHGGGDRGRRRGARPALPDHAAHAHRLRLAEQAGHREGARLAARRGRGAADQGGLRLGSRRPLPGAGRGARALPRDGGRARHAGRGRVERARRGLPLRAPRPLGRALARDRRAHARRLGRRACRASARRRRHGHPQGIAAR